MLVSSYVFKNPFSFKKPVDSKKWFFNPMEWDQS